MSASQTRRIRLSIDVEPELRRKLKVAAAQRDVSIREYVVALLHAAVDKEALSGDSETQTWARLSAQTFARDWGSDEDAIYDDLSQG